MKKYQLWVAVSLALAFAKSITATEPLRVTTQVYSEPKSQLVHHNVTLFTEERIYDFTLVGSSLLTIFDRSEKTATVFNHHSQTQTAVTEAQMEAYISALVERSKTKRLPPHLQALLNGDYEATWHAAKQELSLHNDQVQYRAQLVQPLSTDAASQYRDFANRSAKLNTVLLGPPAGARLKLNTAIFERGRVPKEIHLVMHPQKKADPIRLRSVHVYANTWSAQDRTRVDQAENARRTYAHVTLDVFCKPLRR